MKSSKKTDSFHTSNGPSSLGTAVDKDLHGACQVGSAKEKKKKKRLDLFAYDENKSLIFEAKTSMHLLLIHSCA